MFCALNQNHQHLFEQLYVSYRKLSKELKNSIKFEVGQAVLEFLFKTKFLTVFIYIFKTAGPIKDSMPFLSSFDNFLKYAYIISKQSVDNLMIYTKHALVWGAVPLKEFALCMFIIISVDKNSVLASNSESKLV